MTVQALHASEKETLTPDPDGVRVIFLTARPYKLGTVSVWVNGLRRIQSWENGFAELGSSRIQMSEAPLAGDSLQAQYEPA